MADRELTLDALREFALSYVARRETTSARLAQVLKRWVHRLAHRDGAVPDEAQGWIAEVVRRMEDALLVDDQRFVRVFVRSQADQGRSERLIRKKLRQYGVDESAVQEAFAELQREQPDAEWQALLRYAKRRGVVRERFASADMKTQQRQRNRLLRAGFGFDVVRRLFESPPDP